MKLSSNTMYFDSVSQVRDVRNNEGSVTWVPAVLSEHTIVQHTTLITSFHGLIFASHFPRLTQVSRGVFGLIWAFQFQVYRRLSCEDKDNLCQPLRSGAFQENCWYFYCLHRGLSSLLEPWPGFPRAPERWHELLRARRAWYLGGVAT